MSFVNKQNESHHWQVYKIVNPLGQEYVGKSFNLKERIRNYRNLSGRVYKQKRLYASLKEYGFDSHNIKVIDCFFNTTQYAHGKERFWIKSSMTNFNKYPYVNGLNLSDGGQGSNGYKMSESHKKIISLIRKDKIAHPNTKIELEKNYFKKGDQSYLKGEKLSEEIKQKISLAKKGKSIKAVPLMVFNQNGELLDQFNSIKDCANLIGMKPSAISKRLSRKTEFIVSTFLIKKK